jgi:hypothetical protein
MGAVQSGPAVGTSALYLHDPVFDSRPTRIVVLFLSTSGIFHVLANSPYTAFYRNFSGLLRYSQGRHFRSCLKNIIGFSNRRPMSSSISSVKARFIFNGFLSIKMSWFRTFFTNLENVPPDGHVV